MNEHSFILPLSFENVVCITSSMSRWKLCWTKLEWNVRWLSLHTLAMPGFAFYIKKKLYLFFVLPSYLYTVVHCRELVSSCDVSIYGGVVTVSGALRMSLSLLVNLISPTLRGRRFAWGAERTEQSDGLGSYSPKISNWDGEDFYSHYECDVETPQDDRCLAEVDMGCIAHCFTIRGRHSLKRLRQTTINITIKEGGVFSKNWKTFEYFKMCLDQDLAGYVYCQKCEQQFSIEKFMVGGNSEPCQRQNDG